MGDVPTAGPGSAEEALAYPAADALTTQAACAPSRGSVAENG
jgi:hypothetical protein